MVRERERERGGGESARGTTDMLCAGEAWSHIAWESRIFLREKKKKKKQKYHLQSLVFFRVIVPPAHGY